MDFVTLALLSISFILFFGFFSEFIFRRFNIPDVLFLIILGFILGPHVLGYLDPSFFVDIAPIFTTFALLFLLFDGAFNINLSSLIREFSQSFVLTTYNFFISSAVITGVLFLFKFDITTSLLVGFALGGVSSAFVIPVLQEMKVGQKVYSLLALESALTDVFCIVFSLTVLEVMSLGGFGVQKILTQLSSLFAVAAMVGIIGGIVWIFLVLKFFREHNYMMAIAYLIFIYVAADFLNGNGAIATLFFGLVLNNSKQLSSIIKGITTKNTSLKKRKDIIAGDLGVSITTPSEEYFYHQISFFLKTFFFVYIGILIDLSDWKALLIGIILSFLLWAARCASSLLTKRYSSWDRKLINVIFARGLAAAAIAQIAISQGVMHAEFLAKVIYVVITGTILLSSLSVFVFRIQKKRQDAVLETTKAVKKTKRSSQKKAAGKTQKARRKKKRS